MEEDIRLIENAIFKIEVDNCDNKYCDDNECWLSENQVKAIENIIQAYKEQKCKADIQDATIKNMQDFMEQLEKENDILKNHVKYKNCSICGKEYRTKRNDSKYCTECAKKANSEWLANLTEEQKAKRREQAKLSMRKYRARKKCE